MAHNGLSLGRDTTGTNRPLSLHTDGKLQIDTSSGGGELSTDLKKINGSAFSIGPAAKTAALPVLLANSHDDIKTVLTDGTGTILEVQKAMSKSIPVSIASDQSAVSVSSAVSKSSTVLVSSAAVEKLEYPKTGSSPIDMTGKHRLLITGQTDDALANCPKLYVVGYSDDSQTIDSTKRLGYSTVSITAQATPAGESKRYWADSLENIDWKHIRIYADADSTSGKTATIEAIEQLIAF